MGDKKLGKSVIINKHQVQDIEGINDRIVRTAEIVSRLYVMQLEEIKLG